MVAASGDASNKAVKESMAKQLHESVGENAEDPYLESRDDTGNAVYHKEVDRVLADVNKVHTSILGYNGKDAPNAMVE